MIQRSQLAAWLAKETDIRPETVVAVSPEALLAIMQSRVVGGAVAVTVRGEALTPEVFARDKVLSWHATVQVDCAGRKVRQGPTTGYAARNLLFEGRQLRAADTDWIQPAAGEPLDQVRRAVCETGFQSPLTDTPPPPLLPPAEPAPAPAPKTMAPAPPPTPPKAAPQLAPRAVSRAGVSAQIAAAGSEAEAERALADLRARLPGRMDGLETRIVKAVVGGKTYHRAIIHGFPDKGAAIAFCAALQAAQQACFVRADLGG
jgi:hypothetical protein